MQKGGLRIHAQWGALEKRWKCRLSAIAAEHQPVERRESADEVRPRSAAGSTRAWPLQQRRRRSTVCRPELPIRATARTTGRDPAARRGLSGRECPRRPGRTHRGSSSAAASRADKSGGLLGGERLNFNSQIGRLPELFGNERVGESGECEDIGGGTLSPAMRKETFHGLPAVRKSAIEMVEDYHAGRFACRWPASASVTSCHKSRRRPRACEVIPRLCPSRLSASAASRPPTSTKAVVMRPVEDCARKARSTLVLPVPLGPMTTPQSSPVSTRYSRRARASWWLGPQEVGPRVQRREEHAI